MKNLIYILCGVIVILVFVSLRYYNEAQLVTLNKDQQKALEYIEAHNIKIEKLHREYMILEVEKRALLDSIAKTEEYTPVIIDKINKVDEGTDKKVDSIKQLPTNERDIWWRDFFSRARKDSLKWGQLDSLQY